MQQLCSALMLTCAGYSDPDLPPPLCAAEDEDKESSCCEDDEDYSYKEETDDTSKIAYVAAAVKADVDFEGRRPLDVDLLAALEWARGKSTQEVIDEREDTMQAIEQLAELIKSEGLDSRWLAASSASRWCCVWCLPVDARDRKSKMADSAVAHISRGVNGPLLEALATKAGYHDMQVVELFRTGAPIVGTLDRCVCFMQHRAHAVWVACGLARAGIGKPIEPKVTKTLEELRGQREIKNKDLIASLRESPHSEKLLQSCKDDAAKGRMEQVRLAHECNLAAVTLSPRFAVEQGKRLGFFCQFPLGVVRACAAHDRNKSGRFNEGAPHR
jgi:hypothetical protein